MTTFADGVFQHGGMPTGGGGGIPNTFGDYYFVDANVSGGGGDGKTKATAFKYAGKANSAIVTNNHDVVMFNANSAINTAETNTEMTLTKNRSHWVGLGGGSRYLGQRSRWTMGVTTGSAIAVVQNTGVGNTFTNLKFDSSDTLATSLYAFADGGEYTQLTNCEIVKSTDLDQTTAAMILCNGDSAYYKNCAFGSLVHILSVKRSIMLMNRTTISGKVARDVVIEDCIFLIKTSSTDASCIHGSGATDIERFMLLKNCQFINAVLGSANCDQMVEFDSAQTEGYVLATGCSEVGATAFSTTTGVFTADPVASATSVSAVQAS